jgi:hypothetical protein
MCGCRETRQSSCSGGDFREARDSPLSVSKCLIGGESHHPPTDPVPRGIVTVRGHGSRITRGQPARCAKRTTVRSEAAKSLVTGSLSSAPRWQLACSNSPPSADSNIGFCWNSLLLRGGDTRLRCSGTDTGDVPLDSVDSAWFPPQLCPIAMSDNGQVR